MTMPLPTFHDNQNAADKQSQALLEQSATSNAQIANSLQPARMAISAYQTAQTAEFRRVAEQSEQARPPLGSAIESAQSARDAQLHAIGRQLNTAVGLPADFPNRPGK
jgi:hypothetical protein